MEDCEALVIPGAGELPEPRVTAPIPPAILVLGDLDAEPPEPLVAGAPCDLDVEIALRKRMPSGHSIEAWMHFVCDVPQLQTKHEGAGNYFACEWDGPSMTYPPPGVPIHGPGRFFPYRRCAGVKLPGGAGRGERLRVMFRGMEAQTYADRLFNVRFVVMDGDKLVGYFGDVGWPVVGGAADHLRVTAPTLIRTGEPFDVRVLVCDARGNAAGSGLDADSFTIECPGLEHGPITADDEHGLAFRVPHVRIAEKGIYYVEVTHGSGVRGLGNPVVARDDVGDRIYWGDPHQHTYLADGRARPAASYAYGRRVAHLDFGAVTPHILRTFRQPIIYLHAEAQQGWPEVARATAEADGDGFSALLGYESSLRKHTGDQDVLLSDLEAKPVEVHLGRAVDSYEEFLEEARKVRGEVMLLPHAHAGGGPGRYSMPDLGHRQPNVEVASVHGVFIDYLHHYLARGHRVGVHGGGDNHMPAMGNAFPGRHYCNTNGLTGAFAATNTRDAIWGAFLRRRTYATTFNRRIYLEFRIGDAGMGGVVGAGPGLPVHVQAAGTRALLKVDLIKNGEVVRTWRPSCEADSALRLMWWDDWPERRTDESRTVGELDVPGARVDLLEALNLLNREEYIRPGDGSIRFRTCAYSCTPRGVLLDVPEGAGLARIHVEDERRGERVLDATFELSLTRRHAELQRALDVEKSQLRAEYVPEIIVPSFHAAADRVALHGGRAAEVEWTEHARAGDWYYVRLEQVDGACAWSSPIWIE